MPKSSCRTRNVRLLPGRTARRLIRFRRNEEGGILIFSLFMFVGMLAMAGIAIDFMRFEMTRTQLQSTLDRAVLAATGLGNELDAKKVVLDYFDKAGLGDYVSADKITVVENKASGTLSYRRVTATAEAELDTLLLKLVNIDTLTAAAAGTAEEGITDLEISMVLDVSGSMDWKSTHTSTKKIEELRKAAKEFVYYMQCNQSAEPSSGTACTTEHGKVSISIVPYSEQVNVGPTLLSAYNVTDEHESSHCVDFDEADFSTPSLSTLLELSRTSHFDPWTTKSYYNDYHPPAQDWTCKRESWREIKPFMDSHLEVYAALDALQAAGNTSIDLGVKWGLALLDPGTREVVTGLTSKIPPGETTAMVDKVFVGRPYDYDQDYNMKVIVLMTDGQNTDQHYLLDEYRDGPSEIWHYKVPDGNGGMKDGADVYSVYSEAEDKYLYVNSNHQKVKNGWQDEPYAGDPVKTDCHYETKKVCTWWGWCKYQTVEVCDYAVIGEPYQMSYPQVWAKFTTYWYETFDFLSDPVKSHDNVVKNTRLKNICTAAKEQGILIYSIGFEVSPGSDAEQVMKACASNTNNYFAANGADLSEVFAAIATSINKLRLTQ
ncbi:Flp pilus assembly protein TadG [Rhodovulum bhavnagarense]|uniref:Flp pilus assembly protein TadG n=1 Tax=Rhodovulum bhavnagarense TaxID=992286 RepID=A0A4R2RGV0_9RHOB|nr:Tad domain-containing protein [Rhodovulum bhavnagarense]TCP62910.1 Flp pilus assembly protein TadG [Rhodovulum bhavnagarense]